jgi:hypothetical protein
MKMRIAKVFVCCALFLAACATAPDFVGEVRTNENIGIVFDQHKRELYSIYSDALLDTPDLAGKVVLRITLDPDGNVIKSTVVESTLADPEVPARLSKLVAEIKFGRVRRRANTTFLYPMQFSPAPVKGVE